MDGIQGKNCFCGFLTNPPAPPLLLKLGRAGRSLLRNRPPLSLPHVSVFLPNSHVLEPTDGHRARPPGLCFYHRYFKSGSGFYFWSLLNFTLLTSASVLVCLDLTLYLEYSPPFEERWGKCNKILKDQLLFQQVAKFLNKRV